MRNTTIWATLGPATSTEDRVTRLVEAGADGFRLNFSHLSHGDALRLVEAIRQASKDVGRRLPVCQDLQGAKVRIGLIAGGSTHLSPGQEFVLTTRDVIGDRRRASVSRWNLPQEVSPGALVLVDDASLQLEVLEVGDAEILCRVVVGGRLSSRKGISVRGLPQDLDPARTRDVSDIAFAVEQQIDWIWLSFVSGASEIHRLKRIIDKKGALIPVMAKIETGEALENLDSIAAEADGICLARGDLGAEIPVEKVPAAQKMVAARCRNRGKPLLLGGQVLHSMISSPTPLRSEALDVFNAVLDGFDGVVLSGETAVGAYPEESVRVLAALIEEAEEYVRRR